MISRLPRVLSTAEHSPVEGMTDTIKVEGGFVFHHRRFIAATGNDTFVRSSGGRVNTLSILKAVDL